MKVFDEYGFYRPEQKTGVKNDIFWSEIESGFGEPGGTPLPRIPKSTPPGFNGVKKETRRASFSYSSRLSRNEDKVKDETKTT